ncbi:hypothetical protein PoB_000622500 [Plakobranchus ocellatus]|uniref:Uncharacterized protein n=1 Tax=Plakobranchus ocellatus TaxID=259542 RepID=A0AAV3YB51_9GAST|nr:hypothetical protein PoB_000622500 [Plakobranchus ocellatus]
MRRQMRLCLICAYLCVCLLKMTESATTVAVAASAATTASGGGGGGGPNPGAASTAKGAGPVSTVPAAAGGGAGGGPVGGAGGGGPGVGPGAGAGSGTYPTMGTTTATSDGGKHGLRLSALVGGPSVTLSRVGRGPDNWLCCLRSQRRSQALKAIYEETVPVSRAGLCDILPKALQQKVNELFIWHANLPGQALTQLPAIIVCSRVATSVMSR